MKHFFAAAALLFTLSAGAQKTQGHLQFQKGQQIEIITTVTSVSEMMGQPLNMHMESTRQLDVSGVSATGATLDHKVKKLKMTFEGLGQDQGFDSEKESDRQSDIGKYFTKQLNTRYTMQVDGYGKVTQVQTAAKDSAAQEDGDMMAGMMGGITAGLEVPEAGDATLFAILPQGEVRKGQRWSDSTSADTATRRRADFTVTDVTTTEIKIDYTEDAQSKINQESMGMTVAIDKKDKNKGQIIIDRKTGLLKQRTETSETTGTASMMGQELPLDTKTTKTIVVKTVQ